VYGEKIFYKGDSTERKLESLRNSFGDTVYNLLAFVVDPLLRTSGVDAGKAYKIANDYSNIYWSITPIRIQIDLASKQNTTSQTINYRLQKLIKSGVIKGFRVGIDISKFDLQYFDVRIILTDHAYRKKIIEYLQNKPFFKCINTAFGYTDLEMEFILKNIDKLIEIMDDLNEKFPHVIRNYHYLKIRERYKERWLPKLF